MIDSFFFTAPGGREQNEDAVGQREIPGGTLFLLADGLGGHHRGAEASARVIASMQEASPPEDEEDLEQWLAHSIIQTNDVLLQLQADSGSNMRSTLVALALTNNKAVWGHVGDSRLYCIRGGRLISFTNDHSVAYAKYKSGEITRAQIGQDEDQSSLLRSLGNPTRNQPDLASLGGPPQPGDGFLLCSDGVWEYLYDGEILADFCKSAFAEDWARRLLLRVMGRIQPGNDNLSLITIMVS